MNRLVLLALVGFVLAIGLALPYSDDEDPITNGEIEEVSNDFKAKEAESDLDSDDEKYFPHGKEDEDDDEDGDDDDYEEDEDEDDDNPLTNPLKKSSDPFFQLRKALRRRRRRSRRRGFRFRRFFGRRRGGR